MNPSQDRAAFTSGDAALPKQEGSMTIGQAIEAEAQAQAICMRTRDFERADRAFVAKSRPVFEGN